MILPDSLSPPIPIDPAHRLADFDCGVAVLNGWLVRQALRNETSGASRTFIVGQNWTVAGYYSLAVGSVQRNLAPGKIRRNMPEQVPVMVLGRLAVDIHWQGKGVGQGLLKDALLRTSTVARQAGIRSLIVHALSETARSFYVRHGFLISPQDRMTLMLGLEKLGIEGI
jgi:GNAT superfamily N-acetyltransferase